MSALSGLGRNVFALAAASFFTDVASEMVFPLLPVFLTGALGASAAWVGLVEGSAQGLSSLLRIVSGRLADRTRRSKGLVLAGYGLSVLARPLFALAGSAVHVLGIRLLDRVGKGIRLAPRDALLAASCDPAARGRAFGLQKAMDHLGAAVGPAIAAVLLLRGWSIRDLFLLTALPAACVLVVIGVFVRETGPHEPSAAPGPAPDDPAFRRFLAAAALFTLGAGADAFLILRARDLGLPEAWIPAFWGGINLVRMLLAFPGGALADRHDRRRIILAGWWIHAGVFAGLAFAGSLPAFLVLAGVHALYFALGEGSQRALVADLVPRERRGAAYGLYHLVTGLAAIPGGAGFGLIWKWRGPSAAFLAAATVAGAAGIALARVRKT